MENQFTQAVQKRPRNGMAIASLVLGILSIPTFGLVLAGGVVGLILGIVALRRANRDPVKYGGKALAIGGIVTSGVSFLIAGMVGIVTAIAIPNLLKSAQVSRESSARAELKNIASAQVLYSVTKGRGKFTDLRTLAAAGMIDPLLGSGEKGGYRFNTGPVVVAGLPAMFDTTARPISVGPFGTGNWSFYSNETLALWEVEGGDPPQPSSSDRIPKPGSVLPEPADRDVKALAPPLTSLPLTEEGSSRQKSEVLKLAGQ